MKVTLEGQMVSGKNSIIVTRTGQRFPSKRFKDWRDTASIQLTRQLPKGNLRYANLVAFPKPERVSLTVLYWPGDLIRRDAPGMLDALCHLLERTQVVEDDAQIKTVNWQEMDLDRARPRVELTLTTR